MLTKHEMVDESLINPDILDTYLGQNYCVFDIETTGFSRSSDIITLTCMLLSKEDKLYITQYFAESPEEEAAIIEKTMPILTGCDAVFTYNGRAFDIPFLIERAKKTMTAYKTAASHDICNIDLLRLFKNHLPLTKNLKSYRQRNVEAFFGISPNRKDEISSADNVTMYREYLYSKDRKIAEKLMLHNYDDVRQLHRLANKACEADLDKFIFSEGIGYTCKGTKFRIEKITVDNGNLIISGRQKNINALHFSDSCSNYKIAAPMSYKFSKAEESFHIQIGTRDALGQFKYIDPAAFLESDELDKIKDKLHLIDNLLPIVIYNKIEYRNLNLFAKAILQKLITELLRQEE